MNRYSGYILLIAFISIFLSFIETNKDITISSYISLFGSIAIFITTLYFSRQKESYTRVVGYILIVIYAILQFCFAIIALYSRLDFISTAIFFISFSIALSSFAIGFKEINQKEYYKTLDLIFKTILVAISILQLATIAYNFMT